MDKIEIQLELTQEEADKVAHALERIRRAIGLEHEDAELFSDVALAFRNTTRDARQRASDDYERLIFEELA